MKITFLLGGGFTLSGGDRVVATHAANLVKRGHTVTVASAPLENPNVLQRLRDLVKGRAQFRYSPDFTYFADSGARCIVTKQPHRITNQDLPDADVIVPTWWQTSHEAELLSASKGKIVQFMQHYEVFDYTPKEKVEQVWRMPYPKIVISQWLADKAFDAQGNLDNTFLVPNSVDTKLFNAPHRSKNDIPSIGYLYNVAPWKGATVAEEAIRRIANWCGPLRVVTFGHGPYEPEFPGNVQHIHHDSPPQRNLASIYSECDVWMSSSDVEGFCLPMLEAMACRTPVVATATGGPVDVIEDGVNGYIAPIRDATTLGERLIDVLQMNELSWQRMSAHALTSATSYTWDDATERFEMALNSALTEHPAS